MSGAPSSSRLPYDCQGALDRSSICTDFCFITTCVAAAAMTPTGAVTLDALKALPPLQSLAGDLPDDLSADEIAGCWTDAGLAVDGAADRAGFERAWFLLDDLYDDDLMVEARRPPKVAKA